MLQDVALQEVMTGRRMEVWPMARMILDRRELLVAAGVCGLVGGAQAQAVNNRSDSRAAALIPRRLLFADPARSVVRISPDGRRVAFLAPVDGVLNLWVGAIDDIGNARALTQVTDRSLGPTVLWMHDNRHVVFFREQGGDENWQAHRVDVATGDILALTPAPGVRSYIQQTSHHFPSELLIAHNARDKRFFDIHRVNVVTGASVLLQDNDRFAGFFSDPQFRVRFALRYADNGDHEYLQRGAGGEWELFARVRAD